MFVRFYGLLFVVYRGKDTQFFKVARNQVRFRQIGVFIPFLIIVENGRKNMQLFRPKRSQNIGAKFCS